MAPRDPKDFETELLVGRVEDTNGVVYAPGSFITAPVRYEFIDSVDTPMGKNFPKPCYHWKAWCTQHAPKVWSTGHNWGLYTTPAAALASTNDPANYIAGSNRVHVAPVNIRTPVPPGELPPPWLPDIDRVLDDAFDKCIQRWNLLNFVFELDDIPKMLGQLRHLFNQLTHIGSWQTFLHTPFRTLRQEVPDAVLGLNLGVLPVFSDFLGIRDRVILFDKKMEMLAEKLSLGFRIATGRRDDTSRIAEGYYGSFSKVSEETRQVWGAYVVGHVPYRDGLGYWLNRLGLVEDPFGVLWNATPFSFLVDYVIPIGDFYSAPRVMQPSVLYAWHTIKRRGYFDSYFSCYDGNVVTQQGAYICYDRRVGRWDDFDNRLNELPREVHPLNPGQWSNVLSLLLSFINEI